MQKILALLLIIGLTNAIGKGEGGVDVLLKEENGMGMGNMEAVKNIGDKSGKRLTKGEEEGNKFQLEQAFGGFDTCMETADDETKRATCFRVAMKAFQTAGSEEDREIAELAEKIIGCKNGTGNIGDCIIEASNEKGLEGEAKKTVEFIEEALKAQEEFVKIIQEEEAEFKKNYKCKDVVIEDENGNEIKTQECTPTDDYQKTLDDLQKKYNEEFDRTVKTVEVEVVGIDGEKQKVKIYQPTPAAIKEQIERNNKTVEELQETLKEEGEKVSAEEKKIVEQIIVAIKADNVELNKTPKTTQELKDQIQKQVDALKKMEKQNAIKEE